jgi:inhibitor of growth protein 3
LSKASPLTIMPRDDLSIDFIGRKARMPQAEHQDAATVLDEWTNRVANLPAEIAFMQDEIEEKDKQMNECLTIIKRHDDSIQKWIRINGSHTPNPKEESLSRIILENYDKAQILQEEKVALALKAQQILDKHTRQLDGQIKGLQDRGEFPNDPDIPSLLRPQPAERVTGVRIDTSVAAMPLGPITNSAAVMHRHPNQHPPRMIPAHVQARQLSGVSFRSRHASGIYACPSSARIITGCRTEKTTTNRRPWSSATQWACASTINDTWYTKRWHTHNSQSRKCGASTITKICGF